MNLKQLRMGLVGAGISSLLFSTPTFAAPPTTPLQTFTATLPSLGTYKQLRVVSDGTVYVMGTDINKFEKVSANGSASTDITYSPAIPTNSGTDFVTPDGTSFFTSLSAGSTGRLYKHDVSADVATLVSSAGNYSGATSMTLGTDNKIYMTRSTTIRGFDTDLNVSPTCSIAAAPARSAINAAGTLYYVSTAGTLRRVTDYASTTSSNTDTSIVSGLGGGVLGLYASTGGYNYVAYAATIRKITPAGSTLWTYVPTSLAAMNLDSSGKIYWVDTSGVIRVVAPINAPSAFSATPGGTTMDLAWTTAVSDSDFVGVTIRRSMSTYPTLPTDGDDVTSNNVGASLTDTGLTGATTYYYTAFNKTVDGFYGAGKTATATTLADPSLSITSATTLAYAASISLTTSSLSSGAITFSITAGDTNCVISGNTLTALTGTGSCR